MKTLVPNTDQLTEEFNALLVLYPVKMKSMFPSGLEGYIDSRIRGNYSTDAIMQGLRTGQQPAILNRTTEEDMKYVATEGLRLWESRRKAQGLQLTAKKTTELQLEFLIGAVGILDSLRNDGNSCIPPLFYFSAIRGEYIVSKDEQ